MRDGLWVGGVVGVVAGVWGFVGRSIVRFRFGSSSVACESSFSFRYVWYSPFSTGTVAGVTDLSFFVCRAEDGSLRFGIVKMYDIVSVY